MYKLKIIFLSFQQLTLVPFYNFWDVISFGIDIRDRAYMHYSAIIILIIRYILTFFYSVKNLDSVLLTCLFILYFGLRILKNPLNKREEKNTNNKNLLHFVFIFILTCIMVLINF